MPVSLSITIAIRKTVITHVMLFYRQRSSPEHQMHGGWRSHDRRPGIGGKHSHGCGCRGWRSSETWMHHGRQHRPAGEAHRIGRGCSCECRMHRARWQASYHT
uniref:Uncharacterized protein n=1 Tax=Trichogramma kaykai TaxID=54128 RepID=A0ABD2XPS0_9HYME